MNQLVVNNTHPPQRFNEQEIGWLESKERLEAPNFLTLPFNEFAVMDLKFLIHFTEDLLELKRNSQKPDGTFRTADGKAPKKKFHVFHDFLAEVHWSKSSFALSEYEMDIIVEFSQMGDCLTLDSLKLLTQLSASKRKEKISETQTRNVARSFELGVFVVRKLNRDSPGFGVFAGVAERRESGVFPGVAERTVRPGNAPGGSRTGYDFYIPPELMKSTRYWDDTKTRKEFVEDLAKKHDTFEIMEFIRFSYGCESGSKLASGFHFFDYSNLLMDIRQKTNHKNTLLHNFRKVPIEETEKSKKLKVAIESVNRFYAQVLSSDEFYYLGNNLAVKNARVQTVDEFLGWFEAELRKLHEGLCPFMEFIQDPIDEDWIEEDVEFMRERIMDRTDPCIPPSRAGGAANSSGEMPREAANSDGESPREAANSSGEMPREAATVKLSAQTTKAQAAGRQKQMATVIIRPGEQLQQVESESQTRRFLQTRPVREKQTEPKEQPKPKQRYEDDPTYVRPKKDRGQPTPRIPGSQATRGGRSGGGPRKPGSQSTRAGPRQPGSQTTRGGPRKPGSQSSSDSRDPGFTPLCKSGVPCKENGWLAHSDGPPPTSRILLGDDRNQPTASIQRVSNKDCEKRVLRLDGVRTSPPSRGGYSGLTIQQLSDRCRSGSQEATVAEEEEENNIEEESMTLACGNFDRQPEESMTLACGDFNRQPEPQSPTLTPIELSAQGLLRLTSPQYIIQNWSFDTSSTIHNSNLSRDGLTSWSMAPWMAEKITRDIIRSVKRHRGDVFVHPIAEFVLNMDAEIKERVEELGSNLLLSLIDPIRFTEFPIRYESSDLDKLNSDFIRDMEISQEGVSQMLGMIHNMTKRISELPQIVGMDVVIANIIIFATKFIEKISHLQMSNENSFRSWMKFLGGLQIPICHVVNRYANDQLMVKSFTSSVLYFVINSLLDESSKPGRFFMTYCERHGNDLVVTKGSCTLMLMSASKLRSCARFETDFRYANILGKLVKQEMRALSFHATIYSRENTYIVLKDDSVMWLKSGYWVNVIFSAENPSPSKLYNRCSQKNQWFVLSHSVKMWELSTNLRMMLQKGVGMGPGFREFWGLLDNATDNIAFTMLTTLNPGKSLEWYKEPLENQDWFTSPNRTHDTLREFIVYHATLPITADTNQFKVSSPAPLLSMPKDWTLDELLSLFNPDIIYDCIVDCT